MEANDYEKLFIFPTKKCFLYRQIVQLTKEAETFRLCL